MFNTTKDLIYEAVASHAITLIRNIRASSNSPVIVTSLPRSNWTLEKWIIDYLPKRKSVQFWAFNKNANESKQNKPAVKRAYNYDIYLNPNDHSRFFYYTEEGALNINLGDFVGFRQSDASAFIDAVNTQCREWGNLHGYHFFNARCKSAESYSEDLRALISNPNARLVLDNVYKHEGDTFLALAYEVASDSNFLLCNNGSEDSSTQEQEFSPFGE